MSKKNPVVATVIVCLQLDGTYRVHTKQGRKKRSLADVDWQRVKKAFRELKDPTAEAVPACTSAPAILPVVPPMGRLLNPEAYSKSEPYWIPGSLQRLHLIDLVHQRAQQLQLPKPSWTEIDALLNPFDSPVREKLAEMVRKQYGLYGLDPIR